MEDRRLAMNMEDRRLNTTRPTRTLVTGTASKTSCSMVATKSQPQPIEEAGILYRDVKLLKNPANARQEMRTPKFFVSG
jgi:hypothetical protein